MKTLKIENLKNGEQFITAIEESLSYICTHNNYDKKQVDRLCDLVNQFLHNYSMLSEFKQMLNDSIPRRYSDDCYRGKSDRQVFREALEDATNTLDIKYLEELDYIRGCHEADGLDLPF